MRGVANDVKWWLRLLALVFFLEIPASGDDRFDRVVRYWEWSNYWGIDGVDFPQAPYPRPDTSIEAVVFKALDRDEGPEWGFCSSQMSVCQAYFAHSDGIVYRATGINIRRNELEAAAYNRFRKREFTDESPVGPEPSWLTHNGEAIKMNAERQRITFRALRLPESVRQRIRHRRAEEAFFRPKYSHPLVAAFSQCTFTFPFADSYAPTIPILLECGSENWGIQLLRGTGDAWEVTVGGSFIGNARLAGLREKILSHTAVKRKPEPISK